MIHILKKSSWFIPSCQTTPEHVFLNRRAFVRRAGIIAGAMATRAYPFPSPQSNHAHASAGLASGQEPGQDGEETAFRTTLAKTPSSSLYPAQRNHRYKLDRPVTNETLAATHNNFYEFTTDKSRVWRLAEAMKQRPWTVEVTGLANKKPKRWDIDELTKRLTLEERLYRFRCVETWSMAVPWTGFAFKDFVELVEPKSTAKYVRLVSLMDRAIMPGLSAGYPWPYHEALTLAEATNELTMLVTGVYGHELPKQHGAPIRLITPWKYGFKNIKSIIKIEFTDSKPTTFWSQAVPDEYGFYANINPQVPHPRWSQATEKIIGTDERRPTLLYNGYAQQVAGLYKGIKNQFY